MNSHVKKINSSKNLPAFRQRLIVSFCAVLITLSATGVSAAKTGTDYYFPGVEINELRAKDIPQSCFWKPWYSGGEFAYSKTVATGSGNNPENWVSYWPAKFKLPQGSKLVMKGEFPHNRYMGLDTYSAAAPIAAIAGYQMEADSKSVNPYLPGANRKAPHRDFTLYVVDEVEPENPEPNTIYVKNPNPNLSVFKGATEFRLRSYLPDRGQDIAGGVKLPKLARLELADGTVIGNQKEICNQININSTTGDLTETALPIEAWNKFIEIGNQLGNPYAPAQPNVTWERFFNAPFNLLGLFLMPNAQTQRDANLPAGGTGGGGGSLAGTQANSYVATMLHHGEPGGDREVAVTTVKVAVTPKTFDGDKFSHKQPIQAQYWSICTNVDPAGNGLTAEGFPTGVRQGMCQNDETIVLNAERYTRIVHTQPQNRPENATNACGWSWLNSGPGDNLERPVAQMILRNGLSPESDFAESSANVIEPYTEASVMGEYLPVTIYMSVEEFEALGCNNDGFVQPEGRPDLPTPIWGTENVIKPAYQKSQHEPGTPVPQTEGAHPVQNFFQLLQYMGSLLK